MPILDVSFQAVLFLIAAAAGFLMGSIYDVIRVFRRIIFHPAFIMFIEDLIYWICASLVVFYIMLIMTKGEVRFFAIAGFFIGMCIYFCTVSRIIIKAAEYIIKLFKCVFIKILSVIKIPFKMLYKMLCRILYPFNAICTKFISALKKGLKKYAKCGKIILSMFVSKKDKSKNKKGVKGK